jgi:hypothetical protein
MNVTLRPEQERVVTEAISAGLIGDAVEAVASFDLANSPQSRD